MKSEEIIRYIERNTAYYHDHTLEVSLAYPNLPDAKVKYIEVNLLDTRSADNIRIHYDKQRDGWIIEQASTFEWINDEACDQDWQEVAFVKAWAREVKP